MARTDSLVEQVCEGSCTKTVQGRHGVDPQETNQTSLWAGEDANALEGSPTYMGELMGNAIVPGCVDAIEILNTPGRWTPSQPAVLLSALPGDFRVCEA